jgi:hypothetical protein
MVSMSQAHVKAIHIMTATTFLTFVVIFRSQFDALGTFEGEFTFF